MSSNVEKKPEVLVVGAGAVGVYFGCRLSIGGAKVSIVARSDYDALMENGGVYKIDGEHGNFEFRPDRILRSAGEMPLKPDFILLALKILPGVDPVKLCGNAVGPDTAFLVIQNGLGSEAALAEAFPENEVIGTIAYIGASRPKPGFIHQQDSCNITFGLHPKGTSPKVALLLELFKKSGLDAKTTDDIVLARWRKLLWNAAYNPLSVLGEHADTWSIMHTPESEKLAETIMEEIASIAEADGHPVGRAAIDGNLKFTKGMSAYKTSMLQDLEAGRALEIDALLGEPLRIAGRHGVKTPVLKTLHALLKLRCRSARP